MSAVDAVHYIAASAWFPLIQPVRLLWASLTDVGAVLELSVYEVSAFFPKINFLTWSNNTIHETRASIMELYFYNNGNTK